MNKQEKYCKKDTKILQTIKNCVTPVYKALWNATYVDSNYLDSLICDATIQQTLEQNFSNVTIYNTAYLLKNQDRLVIEYRRAAKQKNNVTMVCYQERLNKIPDSILKRKQK